MTEPIDQPKEVRTLPPMKLGQGPEWRMPTDLAVRFIQAVYETSQSLAGQCMHKAMTGQDLPTGNGRRRGATHE